MVNLERVSEVSAVFPLLYPNVTGAEFGSGCLSIVDEHYYLPGEMETRQQSHPRTPLGAGQYPKSVLWHQRATFFIWAAFLPAAGEIISPALILLCFTPLLLFPGPNWTWN